MLRAGTPALLMVCGRVAARAADSETFVPLLLSHVRVFGSEVDGSTTLDERRRTMWLGHAANGRPGQERYNERGLTLFVWDTLSDFANLGLDLATWRTYQ